MCRHRILNRGAVISLPLIALVAMAWSRPTEKSQIAGTFTGSITQRQSIEVADAPELAKR